MPVSRARRVVLAAFTVAALATACNPADTIENMRANVPATKPTKSHKPKPTRPPKPTPTATPTATPTPTTATSPTPSDTPTSDATATTQPSPTSDVSATTSPDTSASSSSSTGFPNASTTGVPAGWQPTKTYTSDLTITEPGAVVEDIRLVNADLRIAAPDVTVRRVEIQGGQINNWPNGQEIYNGLVLEQVSLVRAPDQVTHDNDEPAVWVGGFTADRVKIDGLAEGFRVGGVSYGAGPVQITNSFVRIVSPDEFSDWHGDGIQGYDGAKLTVRNTTLVLDDPAGAGGTAPFFYPDNQGNTSAVVDGLLVKGGGYPFRLGTSGTVQGLKIVEDTNWYGPIDVRCSLVDQWQADIVTVDGAYQPTTVRSQPCNTDW